MIQKLSLTMINLIVIGLIALAVLLVANDPVWTLGDKNWRALIVWYMFHRNVYIFCLSILVLLCLKPRGLTKVFFGVFNARVWRPFGQLAFTSFLTHPLVIILAMN